MFAAMNGNVELIKILIGFGAELDAKDTVYGWTALMQATFYGRKEATEIMLRVHFSRKQKFYCVLFIPFFLFGFWSLGNEIKKVQKYYINFVYILQGKMGKTEKSRKKITQLK